MLAVPYMERPSVPQETDMHTHPHRMPTLIPGDQGLPVDCGNRSESISWLDRLVGSQLRAMMIRGGTQTFQ